MNKTMKLAYKIYLEAEDITQSRINSTVSFVKNMFKNCNNTYFKNAQIEDESDLEDFAIRLYIDESLEENECSSLEDAKSFIVDMIEFLDRIALAQSYLEMEGNFYYEYAGEVKEYSFMSESGMGRCEFTQK